MKSTEILMRLGMATNALEPPGKLHSLGIMGAQLGAPLVNHYSMVPKGARITLAQDAIIHRGKFYRYFLFCRTGLGRKCRAGCGLERYCFNMPNHPGGLTH